MTAASRTMLTLSLVATAILGQHSALAFVPSPMASRTSASLSAPSQNVFGDAMNMPFARTTGTSLAMSEEEGAKSSLPMLLDPGTKGGAVFLSILLFIVPIIGYEVVTGVFGVDEIEAGRDIGVGFTVFTMLIWAGSYVFRVATKDMTYAKQLKDYEDAVIAKRLEELDEDEVQALVEEIDRDAF